MDASPWVAMSAMQKAIRRGREDLALSAAATLLRNAPDKLWRRVGCIAYEDVGVASLAAAGAGRLHGAHGPRAAPTLPLAWRWMPTSRTRRARRTQTEMIREECERKKGVRRPSG
jgi:hypothetical protein